MPREHCSVTRKGDTGSTVETPDGRYPLSASGTNFDPKSSTRMTSLASPDAYTGLHPELYYTLDDEEGSFAIPEAAGEQLIASVDSQDFALLERSIELVVQSQAFSLTGLRAALRLDAPTALHLTLELEALGVIDTGAVEAQRPVLVAMHDLALFLANVRLSRRASADERTSGSEAAAGENLAA